MTATDTLNRGIGDNSAAVGQILDERPAAIFEEPDMLTALLADGEKAIADHVVDLTTDDGRSAIKKLARSFASRKTSLNDAGKKLNEDHRKAINVVDEVRRKIREGLDALRDKARKPVTDWEEAEEAKATKAAGIRQTINDAFRIHPEATVADIDRTIEKLAALDLDANLFGDAADQVNEEFVSANIALKAARARIETVEAERVELKRLRDAEAAREAAKSAETNAAKAEETRQANAEIERLAKIARDNAADAAAEDRRKSDVAHRAIITRAAADALIKFGGIGEEAAIRVVAAIVGEQIPNVRMSF